ncbi:hypothetical protein T484DRAFT_1782203, partial [Baffinella frigidus]
VAVCAGRDVGWDTPSPVQVRRSAAVSLAAASGEAPACRAEVASPLSHPRTVALSPQGRVARAAREDLASNSRFGAAASAYSPCYAQSPSGFSPLYTASPTTGVASPVRATTPPEAPTPALPSRPSVTLSNNTLQSGTLSGDGPHVSAFLQLGGSLASPGGQDDSPLRRDRVDIERMLARTGRSPTPPVPPEGQHAARAPRVNYFAAGRRETPSLPGGAMPMSGVCAVVDTLVPTEIPLAPRSVETPGSVAATALAAHALAPN